MGKATQQEIAEAVLGLIENGENQAQIAHELAEYLSVERRSRELDGIMRRLERLRFERDGVLEVVATSPRNLSELTNREITRLFTARQVQIINRHDPDLVGGIRIEALDTQLDLSVRRKLNQLKSTSLAKE